MKRKEVLPKWIRFFAWLHLLSFVAIPVFIIGLFGETSLSAYAISSSGSSLQLEAVWITLLCTLAGVVAVGILWGKGWAINVAIPYAYLATITCAVGFALSLGSDGFTIPFEPFLLIPFINILSNKSERWDNFNPEEEHQILNQSPEVVAESGDEQEVTDYL